LDRLYSTISDSTFEPCGTKSRHARLERDPQARGTMLSRSETKCTSRPRSTGPGPVYRETRLILTLDRAVPRRSASRRLAKAFRFENTGLGRSVSLRYESGRIDGFRPDLPVWHGIPNDSYRQSSRFLSATTQSSDPTGTSHDHECHPKTFRPSDAIHDRTSRSQNAQAKPARFRDARRPPTDDRRPVL